MAFDDDAIAVATVVGEDEVLGELAPDRGRDRDLPGWRRTRESGRTGHGRQGLLA